MTPNRSDLTMEERIEQVLHDFAESLHEYANGRAHGGVYREELDKSATKVERLVLEGRWDELSNVWACQNVSETGIEIYVDVDGKDVEIEDRIAALTAELGELGEKS